MRRLARRACGAASDWDARWRSVFAEARGPTTRFADQGYWREFYAQRSEFDWHLQAQQPTPF